LGGDRVEPPNLTGTDFRQNDRMDRMMAGWKGAHLEAARASEPADVISSMRLTLTRSFVILRTRYAIKCFVSIVKGIKLHFVRGGELAAAQRPNLGKPNKEIEKVMVSGRATLAPLPAVAAASPFAKARADRMVGKPGLAELPERPLFHLAFPQPQGVIVG
jgi:hypothetical protein